MVAGLTPKRRPAARRLVGLPSRSSRCASRSRAIIVVGSNSGRRPRRGASRRSEDAPSLTKRRSHKRTVGGETPRRDAILLVGTPSRARRTIRLRHTTRCGVVAARTHLSRYALSPARSATCARCAAMVSVPKDNFVSAERLACDTRQEVSARGDLRVPCRRVCNACAPPSLEGVASIVNFRCGVTLFAWSEAKNEDRLISRSFLARSAWSFPRAGCAPRAGSRTRAARSRAGQPRACRGCRRRRAHDRGGDSETREAEDGDRSDPRPARGRSRRAPPCARRETLGMETVAPLTPHARSDSAPHAARRADHHRRARKVTWCLRKRNRIRWLRWADLVHKVWRPQQDSQICERPGAVLHTLRICALDVRDPPASARLAVRLAVTMELPPAGSAPE
jgi:hypothetical protein